MKKKDSKGFITWYRLAGWLGQPSWNQPAIICNFPARLSERKQYHVTMVSWFISVKKMKMLDKKAKITATLLATAMYDTALNLFHEIQNLLLIWWGKQLKFQVALSAIFSTEEEKRFKVKKVFWSTKNGKKKKIYLVWSRPCRPVVD